MSYLCGKENPSDSFHGESHKTGTSKWVANLRTLAWSHCENGEKSVDISDSSGIYTRRIMEALRSLWGNVPTFGTATEIAEVRTSASNMRSSVGNWYHLSKGKRPAEDEKESCTQSRKRSDRSAEEGAGIAPESSATTHDISFSFGICIGAGEYPQEVKIPQALLAGFSYSMLFLVAIVSWRYMGFFFSDLTSFRGKTLPASSKNIVRGNKKSVLLFGDYCVPLVLFHVSLPRKQISVFS